MEYNWIPVIPFFRDTQNNELLITAVPASAMAPVFINVLLSVFIGQFLQLPSLSNLKIIMLRANYPDINFLI
jgi:hypothetical protein